jgi:GMP synthase-like glutamine amidotransferase
VLHEHLEDAGHVSHVIERAGIARHSIYPFRGDSIPADLGDYCGIVVMGGLTSAYKHDTDRYLLMELYLLREALALEVPVLGICLGSQLLAMALGAHVFRARYRETGWHDVELTAAGVDDPVLGGLPRRFTALHWHSDNFLLPAAGVHLAASEMTEYQAFRHGRASYGLLFHLEPDEKLFRRMLSLALQSGYISHTTASRIQGRSAEYLPLLARDGERVFSAWLELIGC